MSNDNKIPTDAIGGNRAGVGGWEVGWWGGGWGVGWGVGGWGGGVGVGWGGGGGGGGWGVSTSGRDNAGRSLGESRGVNWALRATSSTMWPLTKPLYRQATLHESCFWVYMHDIDSGILTT